MLLAMRRLEANLLAGLDTASSIAYVETLRNQLWIDEDRIWMQWAVAKGQSAQRVRQVVEELGDIDRFWPTPTDGIINHFLRAREVVRGRVPPSFLSTRHHSLEDWLPYLANRVPGEAARAELALEILAGEAAEFVSRAYARLAPANEAAAARWRQDLRRLQYISRPDLRIGPPTFVIDLLPDRDLNRRRLQLRVNRVVAAQSSYLAVEELRFVPFLSRAASGWIDSLARRRVERVRLALIVCRLEQGKYPESLAALSPNYLAAADYYDPFAAGPLQFRHDGFELPFLQYFAYRRLHPPHTPLLWSIGMSALTPTERSTFIQYREDGTIAGLVGGRDPDQEDVIRRERFVQLTPTEENYSPDPAFVLVLPTEFNNEPTDNDPMR
jgi:hypothetical protein